MEKITVKPETVRKIRHRLQMTQQELADKIGVAKSTICKWESGSAKCHGPAARQFIQDVKAISPSLLEEAPLAAP